MFQRPCHSVLLLPWCFAAAAVHYYDRSIFSMARSLGFFPLQGNPRFSLSFFLFLQGFSGFSGDKESLFFGGFPCLLLPVVWGNGEENHQKKTRIILNSVQTRCIVKARLRKVHFSGDFLGVFAFLRIACSLGIPRENL